MPANCRLESKSSTLKGLIQAELRFTGHRVQLITMSAENDTREVTRAQPVQPSGTVRLLFTDIEGSTKRWEQDRLEMARRVAAHDAMARGIVDKHGGYVFKMVGDSCCAAFARPSDAVAAATDLQQEIARAPWNDPDPVRVRMAIHSGAPEERDRDYFGSSVNRVARLLAAGHGGQILVSKAARELVFEMLPEGVTLTDLGEHRLKDRTSAETIFQAASSGLASKFPALNTMDAVKTNLPVQLTSFIGRAAELARIATLMRDPDIRLLTLTGPGGTGKSRLAVHAGADLVDDFPDGVYMTELAPLLEPTQVVTAVRSSLGMHEGHSGELDSIAQWVASKRLLLVIDNFEHVISAAEDVAGLLRTCANLKILATSRIALHAPGEHVHTAPTLRDTGRDESGCGSGLEERVSSPVRVTGTRS